MQATVQSPQEVQSSTKRYSATDQGGRKGGGVAIFPLRKPRRESWFFAWGGAAASRWPAFGPGGVVAALDGVQVLQTFSREVAIA